MYNFLIAQKSDREDHRLIEKPIRLIDIRWLLWDWRSIYSKAFWYSSTENAFASLYSHKDTFSLCSVSTASLLSDPDLECSALQGVHVLDESYILALVCDRYSWAFSKVLKYGVLRLKGKVGASQVPDCQAMRRSQLQFLNLISWHNSCLSLQQIRSTAHASHKFYGYCSRLPDKLWRFRVNYCSWLRSMTIMIKTLPVSDQDELISKIHLL